MPQHINSFGSRLRELVIINNILPIVAESFVPHLHARSRRELCQKKKKTRTNISPATTSCRHQTRKKYPKKSTMSGQGPPLLSKQHVQTNKSYKSTENLTSTSNQPKAIADNNSPVVETLPQVCSDGPNQIIEENKITNLWGVLNLGTEVLDNEGAVARDHMANERTFLSWIRTSLALTSVGVGITQLFKLIDERHKDGSSTEFLLKVGKPIGGVFIAIAILSVLLGTSRFFRTQELLKTGRYPSSRFSVSILVFLVFGISVVTLVCVIYADR